LKTGAGREDSSALGLIVLTYAEEVLEVSPNFAMSNEVRLFAEKYRILDQIAQGDLASVYQATDVESGEICTLRLFNWEFSSDSSFLDLLKQDALNVEKVRHPNIMPVGKIDQTRKGQIYAVRPFVEGRNLEDVMRLEGALSVRRACLIGRQVASALEAAHNAGIIHGDLKPANILLLEETSGIEAVRVLGFGTFVLKQGRFMDLAHLAFHDPASLIGSAQYISPERAIGTEPEALDGRSDLYSLGAILYEMLSGEAPFRGHSAMEILLDHLFDEPRPLREHLDLEIPEVLNALVMRTLAKHRKDRPSSATVMVDQLQPWQKEEIGSQAPVATATRDEDVIMAGTRLMPEPALGSPPAIVHGSRPEVDESAPTVSIPSPADAGKSPVRERIDQEPVWAGWLSPAPDWEKDKTGSHPLVQPPEREAPAPTLKVESATPVPTTFAEKHPSLQPSFASVPESEPQGAVPSIEQPVEDASSKTGTPEKPRRDFAWSSFSPRESAANPSSAGIDFRASAATAEFAPASGAQSEAFWSSKQPANWDAGNPASEVPKPAARASRASNLEADRSAFTSFASELDKGHPEVSALSPAEQVADRTEGQASTFDKPGGMAADSGIFVADLGEPLPIETSSRPAAEIPDISLGKAHYSEPLASPPSSASTVAISNLFSASHGLSQAAEKPRHGHSILAATILVIFITAAGASGWLFFTGRSYWFQPQYLISRVSGLLTSQSPVPPQPASTSGVQGSPPTASKGSPAAASAASHPESAAPSTSAPSNNGPIQALKVHGPSEAVKGLSASQARTRTRKPPGSTEDSAAVEDVIRRGNYYFLVGKYDDAIRIYDAGLKQSPGNPRLIGAIARARRAKAAEAEFLGH
jgi:eukaryotic-like serine/threonine-protein kinase